MAITDWPAAERPREKLLERGAEALSDAELLAIFLRTGVAGLTAVDLARRLLEQFNGLRGLLKATEEEFCDGYGLGAAKYVQLQAVLEMGRRHLHQRLSRESALDSSETTRHYLTARLRDEPREVFAVLYLDSQHRVIEYEPLFYGTIDGAAVYPRELARKSLQIGAAAVIVAHNHPSGVAEPSRADRLITERIRDALALLDIRLLDHCVIGDGEVVSMAERGWL